jgi:aspartate/methionine/tyrosine aminotransferase
VIPQSEPTVRAFFDFPPEFFRTADAFKVAVVQGSAFGSDETIRISYATSMDVLEKSMKVRNGAFRFVELI